MARSRVAKAKTITMNEDTDRLLKLSDFGIPTGKPVSRFCLYHTSGSKEKILKVVLNPPASSGDLYQKINGQWMKISGSKEISVEDIAAGNLKFTPNNNFFGSLNFSFQLKTETGISNSARVNINVKNVNDAPIAVNSSFLLKTNEVILNKNMLNVTDPDGNSEITRYKVTGLPKDGDLLMQNSRGHWIKVSEQAVSRGRVIVTDLSKLKYVCNYSQLSENNLSSIDGLKFSVRDKKLWSNTAELKIILKDTPIVSEGDKTGSVVEDKQLVSYGKLTSSELSQFTVGQEFSSSFGKVTILSDGRWIYELNNDNPIINSLKNGEQKTDQVTLVSTDGKISQVVNINISGTNDAPVVNLVDNIEKGKYEASLTQKLFKPTDVISVVDPEQNYSGGTLVIQSSISSQGASQEDVFRLVSKGDLTINRQYISYKGELVGVLNLTEYIGLGKVNIQFTENASNESITEILKSVFYRNNGGFTEARDIDISLTDSNGSLSNKKILLTINQENLAPTISGPESYNFTENQANTGSIFLFNTENPSSARPVTEEALSLPAMSVGISDVEQNYTNGRLVIESSLSNGEDVIGLVSKRLTQGNLEVIDGTIKLDGKEIGLLDVINSDPSRGKLVIALTEGATNLSLNALMTAVTYKNTSDNPTLNRQVTVTVTDSEGASGVKSFNINVSAENDAPVITSSNSELIYTQGDLAISINPSLVLDDSDSAHMSGASVTISNGLTAGDVLNFTPLGNITGVYDSQTGILNLTGNDSVANYQEVLRSVTYNYTGDAPTANHLTRTIEFQVTDENQSGGSPSLVSNLATTTLTISPVIETVNYVSFKMSPGESMSFKWFDLVSSYSGAEIKKIKITELPDHSTGVLMYDTKGDGTGWKNLSSFMGSDGFDIMQQDISRLKFYPNPDVGAYGSSYFSFNAFDGTKWLNQKTELSLQFDFVSISTNNISSSMEIFSDESIALIIPKDIVSNNLEISFHCQNLDEILPYLSFNKSYFAFSFTLQMDPVHGSVMFSSNEPEYVKYDSSTLGLPDFKYLFIFRETSTWVLKISDGVGYDSVLDLLTSIRYNQTVVVNPCENFAFTIVNNGELVRDVNFNLHIKDAYAPPTISAEPILFDPNGVAINLSAIDFGFHSDNPFLTIQKIKFDSPGVDSGWELQKGDLSLTPIDYANPIDMTDIKSGLYKLVYTGEATSTQSVSIGFSIIDSSGSLTAGHAEAYYPNSLTTSDALVDSGLHLDLTNSVMPPLMTELLADQLNSNVKAELISLGNDNRSHELVIKLSDFSDNLNILIIEGGHEDRVILADGAAHWQKDQALHQVDGVNFEKYTATTANNETVNVFISEHLSDTIL